MLAISGRYDSSLMNGLHKIVILYFGPVMESSTQLPSTSTSTAKNFEYEYEYWYWKMYSSTSTVKKFEYEYFYKFRKRNF